MINFNSQLDRAWELAEKILPLAEAMEDLKFEAESSKKSDKVETEKQSKLKARIEKQYDALKRPLFREINDLVYSNYGDFSMLEEELENKYRLLCEDNSLQWYVGAFKDEMPVVSERNIETWKYLRDSIFAYGVVKGFILIDDNTKIGEIKDAFGRRNVDEKFDVKFDILSRKDSKRVLHVSKNTSCKELDVDRREREALHELENALSNANQEISK